MIFGVGTDIVSIARIGSVYQHFGARFADRILTDVERSDWSKRDYPIEYLAARFAAKEAVFKAFGLGLRQGLSFQHVQIMNNAVGKPEAFLLAEAKRFCQQHKVNTLSLSLAHERDYAVAFVVLS